MSGQGSVAGVASKGRARAPSAQDTPRQNHLLAALPLRDYECLLPDLKPIPLPLGWTIHRAGDRQKYLYFLTAGIVSKLSCHDGPSIHI